MLLSLRAARRTWSDALSRTAVHTCIKGTRKAFFDNIVEEQSHCEQESCENNKSCEPDLAILDGFNGMEGEGPALENGRDGDRACKS